MISATSQRLVRLWRKRRIPARPAGGRLRRKKSDCSDGAFLIYSNTYNLLIYRNLFNLIKNALNLVAEMAYAGKNHGNAQLIASLYDIFIFYRASRLNYGPDSFLVGDFY